MGLFIPQPMFFCRKKRFPWKFIPFWDILHGSLGMKQKKLEYKMMWRGKGKGGRKKGRSEHDVKLFVLYELRVGRITSSKRINMFFSTLFLPQVLTNSLCFYRFLFFLKQLLCTRACIKGKT